MGEKREDGEKAKRLKKRKKKGLDCWKWKKIRMMIKRKLIERQK